MCAPRCPADDESRNPSRASGRGFWLALVLGTVVFLRSGGPVQAAEPAAGTRSLAMGDTLRAAATGSEGVLLNPSGMAITRMLTAAAFYSLRVQTLGHVLHASISDSLMQKWLALGLYYNFVYETPHFAYKLNEGGGSSRIVVVQDSKIVRTGSESGIVIAVPISDRFSLGGTVKYGNYSLASTLTDGSVPADFNYQSPRIDMDHNVDLGSIGNVVTFDLGFTARIYDELRLAVVGQNLWPHGIELPSILGIGLSYRPSSRWLLAGDGVVNFTGSVICTGMPPDPCTETTNRNTWRLGLGFEYSIADKVPVRAGYMYDNDLGAHHVSGGIGYFSQDLGFGVDFAMRQRVEAGNETVLLLGLRYVKQ